MIIAWPLSDIVSYTGGKMDEHPAEQRRGRKKRVIIDNRTIYQKAGIPTEVIGRMNEMMFLTNKRGVIFAVNVDRIIWCKAGS